MTGPGGSGLVPTDTAASALGLQTHELTEWAELGVVRATTSDDDGQELWDLDDLRSQVVTHIEEHGGSWPGSVDAGP